MARYRDSLPQLTGDFFLTDAGIETDIIFNKGVEIREFAAHTLLPEASGRQVLKDYFRGFLTLAKEMDAGFQLDSQKRRKLTSRRPIRMRSLSFRRFVTSSRTTNQSSSTHSLDRAATHQR